MTGILHDRSSGGLKYRGPFAPRYCAWPPEGFAEPTEDELEQIKNRAQHGLTGIYLRRMDPEALARTIEVIAWFGSRGDADRSKTLYDYLHEVRREIRRRRMTPPQRLNILRCAMCSHGTERLFEATPDTHNIVDRNDEPCAAMLCVQCWSTYVKEEA